MAVPIEMPFGLRTVVGPGNYVLDGGPDPPWEGAILVQHFLHDADLGTLPILD